jgi:hypothetical protein
VKLKRTITFIKGQRKKIINQNNENRIEKYNTIYLNQMMRLKTTKTFTKKSRIKIINSKNKDHIGEYNIW